jgi:hexokinase
MRPHSPQGEVRKKDFQVPGELRSGPVSKLYDMLARATVDFVTECGIDASQLTTHGSKGRPVLGFCFSFPMEQTALDSGLHLRWTKGGVQA